MLIRRNGKWIDDGMPSPYANNAPKPIPKEIPKETIVKAKGKPGRKRKERLTSLQRDKIREAHRDEIRASMGLKPFNED